METALGKHEVLNLLVIKVNFQTVSAKVSVLYHLKNYKELMINQDWFVHPGIRNNLGQ